ncbi:3-oxo-5-alpha-steroid 4-dehydrogenase [Entomophthora muscae]|uniref:3-oxo-5-alpha-steroid 4-dehydrogenase n=1 Tax=Entomophthora muscae TaxID=34485 RepID=A0ACC2RXN0_9FUNG|nr:3-oxo-5-alpha-steroid 4-dehydrogenase [Entomophthora muscae]
MTPIISFHQFLVFLVGYLIPIYYLLMTSGIFLTLMLPQLTEAFAKYGKSRNVQEEGSDSDLKKFINFLGQLTVPKSYFRHYYWFASIWNPSLFVLDKLFSWNFFNVSLLSLFVQLQFMRRLYEVQCIQKLSNQAQMHVLHYILGLGHYFCLAITANSLDTKCSANFSSILLTSISSVLFSWSSFNQFKAHLALANLRASGKMDYSLPCEGYFKKCSSPHYFFEILVYFSFVSLTEFQSLNLWLALVFVICNLTTTAYFTHSWYLQTFPENCETLLQRHPILVFGPSSLGSKKNI